MSLFDPACLPVAPPPVPSVERCGVMSLSFPSRWTLRRLPRCNRPAGHTGPHQEIRVGNFELRAEWTDER